MTADEFAAAFLGGVSRDEREATRREGEQFKTARPDAVAQLRDQIQADRLRQAALDAHDQLDSAHWLTEQLEQLLSREGRELDQKWRGEVKRILRLLCAHFNVAGALLEGES